MMARARDIDLYSFTDLTSQLANLDSSRGSVGRDAAELITGADYDGDAGVGPSGWTDTFKRAGVVKLSIGFHSSAKHIPVETTGLVEKHVQREVGDETTTVSFCDIAEQVDFFDLPSLSLDWPHPDGRVMTFATADRRMPGQIEACVLRGGKMGDQTTEATATIRVVCSNSVIFDSSKGWEHFLFFFGPQPAFKKTFYPDATKVLGTARLEIFDLTNGERYLGGFAMSAGEGEVQYMSVENRIRELYPDDVFDGRRIGFKLTVSSTTISPGPTPESNMRLLGSNCGFSVLPMKRK